MPTLKILAWNIWMMPAWTFQSPSNVPRARAICEELAKLDFDIVCFIKAFDASARRELRDKLGALYPHRYGPLNFNGSIFKINGGVYIFSRIPLTLVREIQWRNSAGSESHSRKGAMLLRGELGASPFELIALHMQGESTRDIRNQDIRNRQIAQLAAELVDTTSDPAVPLFICGDFNTARRTDDDPLAESPDYLRMMERLGTTTGRDFRVTLDDNPAHNDLAADRFGRVAELDYVLVRANGHKVTGKWHTLHLRRQGWDGANGRKDLAYRYAVCSELTF
jgi:endonuclease/exonuclease/phosphatase family metal-dependent hydrolase